MATAAEQTVQCIPPTDPSHAWGQAHTHLVMRQHKGGGTLRRSNASRRIQAQAAPHVTWEPQRAPGDESSE